MKIELNRSNKSNIANTIITVFQHDAASFHWMKRESFIRALFYAFYEYSCTMRSQSQTEYEWGFYWVAAFCMVWMNWEMGNRSIAILNTNIYFMFSLLQLQFDFMVFHFKHAVENGQMFEYLSLVPQFEF